MRLLQLEFTFKVEHMETEQVSVTFNTAEHTVLCSSFLYSGSMKEKIYRTNQPPTPELASRVARTFLAGLEVVPGR